MGLAGLAGWLAVLRLRCVFLVAFRGGVEEEVEEVEELQVVVVVVVRSGFEAT